MACLLCGHDSLNEVHDHGDGHALSRCADCGLLQTVPMPSAEYLSSYYQRYDVLGAREPYYRAMWGQKALETPEGHDVRDRFLWAKGLCGNFGKVLDVGSGPGLFLRLAKEDGAEPVGVELNAEAAQRSAQELGVKVVAGSIGQAEERGFGAVALWDIIEHVPDPRDLIKECSVRLKPGGWLFIETPDEGALLDRAVLILEKLGIRGPAQTFYGLHHLVLFRRATLCRLLTDNGFEVIETRPAETQVSRIFRGNGFRDKMVRLGLGGLFFVARLVGRRNKMLVAARKA